MTQNDKNNVFLELKVLLEMPKFDVVRLTYLNSALWGALLRLTKSGIHTCLKQMTTVICIKWIRYSKLWDLCLIRFLLFLHTPHFDLLRLTCVKRALEGHRWGWQTLKFLSLITKWPLLHLAAKNVCHNWISTHMCFHITLWG